LEKIKVGIVNYLNTRPLIYGLENSPIKDKILLQGNYPSKVAEQLLNDEIDLGLVPVAVLKKMQEYHIVGNHCIGTQGEIASVALFSEVPLQEIQQVYLDYQSRTSVALLKYLMKESWGISPAIVDAKDDQYLGLISGTTAGLVIGDRAFEQRKKSTFIYDLGSEWRAITGLPFVFAVWVSKRKLPDDFIQEFDEANALGLHRIEEIVAEENYEKYELKKYYQLHLSYELDEGKKKGLERFLQVIA
jgi:chorismate dehydratase